MALTLMEAVKQMPASRETGIIGTYAKANQALMHASLIPSDMYHIWKVEDTKATSAARDVNADHTASNGTVQPFSAQLKIYGGKIQVDEYIADLAASSVAFNIESQIKSLGTKTGVDLFEGAGGTSMKGIRSYLQTDAIYSSQTVESGATTVPVIITIDMIDELLSRIDIIPGRTFLYMNQKPALLLKKLNRGNNSSGYNVVYDPAEIGRFDYVYQGVPIMVMKDGKNADLLSITETDKSGGASNSSSIYAVTWGPDMCTLVGNGSLVGGVPMPKITTANAGTNYEYTRLNWYVNIAPKAIGSVARLRYVKNATS